MQLTELNNDILKPETLDSLITTHGSRLYYKQVDEAVIVVKPLSKPQYRAMQSEMESEATKAEKKQVHLSSYEIGEKWVSAAVVYPDKTQFKALLEEYPGLVDIISQDLVSLAQTRQLQFFLRLEQAPK
jgi:hypothetical protein